MGNSGCTRCIGSTRSRGIDAEVGNPGFDLLVDRRCIMMVRFMVHIGFGQNVDCHGDGIILWETNQKSRSQIE